VYGSKSIRVFGAAIGRGAGDEACALGPEALRRAGLLTRLQQQGLRAKWETTIPARREGGDLAAVRHFSRELARPVRSAVLRGHLPLVVGGDHSCAVGTWSGVASAVHARGALGLIWIDAHMDAHVPHTSPSGNLHGMPLACLLGHGDSVLSRQGGRPALSPQHVCLMGVRSYEPDEARLLARLGVRVMLMEEVERRGVAACMQEALRIARAGTAAYGISLDIDSLDPEDAPGVGTPVPGGIRAAALAPVLAQATEDARFAALEVVEYNSVRDRGGMTARLVVELAGRALDGHAKLALAA